MLNHLPFSRIRGHKQKLIVLFGQMCSGGKGGLSIVWAMVVAEYLFLFY